MSRQLAKAYFCPEHSFARVLLRRAQSGTHVKSEAWADLRKAVARDREMQCRARGLWLMVLVALAVVNVLALCAGGLLLSLRRAEARCGVGYAPQEGGGARGVGYAAQGATRTLYFEARHLASLHIETTRGDIEVVLAPPEARLAGPDVAGGLPHLTASS